MSNNCPLCANSGDVFYEYKTRLYYQCCNCEGIFVDKNLVPDNNREKLRYEEHNNDIYNKGYQGFVSPITQAILHNFTPNDKGLDFGAGTGPVISKLLTDKNYSIVQYDPFFHNYPELLDATYDYIACCEVIEHFHHPRKEFALLKTLLKPNGKLYCMTDLYDKSIDFHKWYYKNDETHVFFYTKKAIEWVKKEIGFSQVEIDGRLIIFSN